MRTVDLKAFIARHPYAVIEDMPGEKFLPRRFASLACAAQSAGTTLPIVGPDGQKVPWYEVHRELKKFRSVPNDRA